MSFQGRLRRYLAKCGSLPLWSSLHQRPCTASLQHDSQCCNLHLRPIQMFCEVGWSKFRQFFSIHEDIRLKPNSVMKSITIFLVMTINPYIAKKIFLMLVFSLPEGIGQRLHLFWHCSLTVSIWHKMSNIKVGSVSQSTFLSLHSPENNN